MSITERERKILLLRQQGLSDYKIARAISMDPPSVTRSRKNAHKKLFAAQTDLDWAAKMGVNISDPTSNNIKANQYDFFL